MAIRTAQLPDSKKELLVSKKMKKTQSLMSRATRTKGKKSRKMKFTL
jgi:hypothetical protein